MSGPFQDQWHVPKYGQSADSKGKNNREWGYRGSRSPEFIRS
jgi:hypothetical protein